MKRAFTLIELMIVVAIIAIIAAIAIPRIVESRKEKAEKEAPTPSMQSTAKVNGAPFGIDSAIMVLPSGERVLVLRYVSPFHGDTSIASVLLPERKP